MLVKRLQAAVGDTGQTADNGPPEDEAAETA